MKGILKYIANCQYITEYSDNCSVTMLLEKCIHTYSSFYFVVLLDEVQRTILTSSIRLFILGTNLKLKAALPVRRSNWS